MLLTLIAAAFLLPAAMAAGPESDVEVYGLKYGDSLYKTKFIFADGDDSRVPLAWVFWVVKEKEAAYLVDAGIQDTKLLAQWRIENYSSPLDLLKALNLSPESITGIILTHMHADHADGCLAFPKTRVFLQQKEYDAVTKAFEGPDKAGKSASAGYCRAHLEHLQRLRQAGLLTLLDGDAEITPNIRVELAPYHTRGTQSVIVNTGAKNVWLIPDNAYLYENMRRQSVSASVDKAGHVEYLRKVMALDPATNVVIPGHEPRLFKGQSLIADKILRLPVTAN
jgi:glyoxylase-like metal-dependent hydrolase (beta-lactamase superfamily II)